MKGRLDGKRLLQYPYPPGSRPGRKQDYNVAAFLLEVSKQGLERSGADARRELAWRSAEEARTLLEKGRDGDEQKYADAMKGAIDAAVEAIEQNIE